MAAVRASPVRLSTVPDPQDAVAAPAAVPGREVDVIGYTIGAGPIYRELAARSAERMQAMTGLTCMVLGDEECDGYAHPAWAKLAIWERTDADAVLYFDADVFCIKPWDPHGIIGDRRGFWAVPEYTDAVIAEALAIGLTRSYANAGLFIATRECRPAFEDALARHPEWHRWLDQSALNRALQDRGIDVHLLPDRLNRLVSPSVDGMTPAVALASDAVCVHLAGRPGYPESRLEWQRQLFGVR